MRPDPLSFLTAELETLKAQGLYRHLRVLSDEQKAKTTVDDRLVVNLSSNNYLGLTTHPRLRERALEAIQRYGVGSGSVRPIAGTLDVHLELERRLADFKQTEAAVVFQSGFTANAGTVAAILTRDDVVISDELNHASIIDGCRLSRASVHVFPHKDVDAARRILTGLPSSPRKILITDGVFSMDGDLGPLPALCTLAEPRVRRQPEVVVRREVDHIAVVDGRPRFLLVFENAQLPVEPLRLERREFGRQVGQRIAAHEPRNQGFAPNRAVKFAIKS